MSEALNHRVGTLKAALETIEREVVAGAPTRETLEEFKLAVDHVRISVWAILTAEHSGGHQGVVAQFRMKRVKEMCRHLIHDLDAGLIPAADPELDHLRNVLENVVARVARLRKTGE